MTGLLQWKLLNAAVPAGVWIVLSPRHFTAKASIVNNVKNKWLENGVWHLRPYGGQMEKHLDSTNSCKKSFKSTNWSLKTGDKGVDEQSGYLWVSSVAYTSHCVRFTKLLFTFDPTPNLHPSDNSPLCNLHFLSIHFSALLGLLDTLGVIKLPLALPLCYWVKHTNKGHNLQMRNGDKSQYMLMHYSGYWKMFKKITVTLYYEWGFVIILYRNLVITTCRRQHLNLALISLSLYSRSVIAH